MAPLFPLAVPLHDTVPGAPVLTEIEPSVPLQTEGSVDDNVITGVGLMEIVNV